MLRPSADVRSARVRGASVAAIQSDQELATPVAPSGAKPGAQAWTALGILCFVYVLNFLDRQLLSILAKPIQDSLHVSDGQLGMIGGLSLALFFCFSSIPV